MRTKAVYCIVEPVFGGLGPATYRSAEAPVVSEVRRGTRDTYAEYESPTLYRQKWWCMHGTRGSTHTVTRNSPSPLRPKNQASGRLERAARTRSCRRAAEHGSGFMILATHPPTNQQGEPARYQRDITRLPARPDEISARCQRDISEIERWQRTPYSSSASPSPAASEGFSSWE